MFAIMRISSAVSVHLKGRSPALLYTARFRIAFGDRDAGRAQES